MTKHHGLGEFGTTIIIIMLGILLITGGTLFYGDVFNRNGVASYQNATDATGASNAYNELNSTTNDIGSALSSSSAYSDNTFLVLLTGAFAAVKSLFTMLGAITSLVFGVGGFFTGIAGINVGWATVILAGIFVAFLIFVIFKIVLGRDV